MELNLSETTFRRLQGLAEPFVDSPEDVILRLIDAYEGNKGGRKLASATLNQKNTRLDKAPASYELRGFQNELWKLVIGPMPTTRFSLQDVYARKEPLVALRPHVKEIEASIRAGLEKLRDKGFIEFIDNRGQYRRLR